MPISNAQGARKTVLWSIEAPGGQICVDLFRRANGTFGFEEYRRDPEDGRGWFATGCHADGVFETQVAAEAAAMAAVSWLAEVR